MLRMVAIIDHHSGRS